MYCRRNIFRHFGLRIVRRRPTSPRLIATPTSASVPPTIRTAVGTSANSSHDMTTTIAGTASVVDAMAPASVRANAYAQVVKATAVGPLPGR